MVFGALSCRVGLAAGWYAVCLPGFCPLVVVEAYGWGVGPLQGGGGTGRNASIDGWWGAMRTLPAPVGLFVLAVATVSALVAGAALMGVPAAQAAAGTSPYTTLSVQHLGFRVLSPDQISPGVQDLRDTEAQHGLDPDFRVVMRLDLQA